MRDQHSRHRQGTPAVRPDRLVSKDPIETLTRRTRRAWLRAERRIIAEHESEVVGQLRRLAILQPTVQVKSTPEPGNSAIVSLTLPGWQIHLAPVAIGPRVALSEAADSHQPRFSGGGRYGRFWWLRIDGGPGPRIVLLGSHLRLNPDTSGPETQDTRPSPHPNA